jgi:WD repeat-containing protein 19
VSLYPKPKGTRFIVIDEVNDAFVCDPVAEGLGAFFNIPNMSAKTAGILWETGTSSERSIFIAWDDAYITTYAFQSFTFKGKSHCLTLGTTKLPFGLKPLIFYDGAAICQTPGGKISSVTLTTHDPLTGPRLLQLPELAQGKAMQLAYTLGRMEEIWSMINIVTSRKAWTMCAEAALHILDLPTAQRIYRQILHDTAMSMTLSSLSKTEDLLCLAGHIAVIFSDFELAQDHFLQSSEPRAALDMRRDLMQWESALNLAVKLAPREVTIIAKEYAAQLEGEGKYVDALSIYERALQASNDFPDDLDDVINEFYGTPVSQSYYGGLVGAGNLDRKEEHQISCSSGITRMTFRMGDVARGMKMLNGVDDIKLLGDCAAIIEILKMYAESGSLYERAGMWEKAAEVYIRGKLWNKVQPLLDKVTSPRIFLQYAKAKEAAQQYADAAIAYERGKDYENLVRVYVEHLKNVEAAVSIVRETRSKESARIVSKFFLNMRDYKSVVEFYLMAGMFDEAFELAQQNDVMEHFAELIKDEAGPEMRKLLAYRSPIESVGYLSKY